MKSESRDELVQRYEQLIARKIKLDLARGQLSIEQFKLSDGLWRDFDAEKDFIAADGTETRNYPGGPYGLAEAREFFSTLLQVTPQETIVGGNASLELMQQNIVWALLRGVYGSPRPWAREERVKFICPVPGYDRHFKVCEALGIELIPVPINQRGPEMETLLRLVAEDPAIKGMWAVPQYSNPTGITYADEVVDELARMKTAATDFRIFWDNAYVVHHLYEAGQTVKNILDACKSAGNPHRVLIFGSTSKITYSSAGVAYMGASKENIEHFAGLLSSQTISANKLNQLRHVRFLRGFSGGVSGLMSQHAAILRPRFELVQEVLRSELGGEQIDSGFVRSAYASWTVPRGGYFVSLDTNPGLASKVGELAAKAGVTLTEVGSTFPYKKDTQDQNIRIAPSRPALADVRQAMEVLAVCVKLAAA